MSNVAVRVEGLGKRYHIGRSAEPYRTLREALVSAASAPLRNLKRLRPGAAETAHTVWALRDVSFEVKHGEVLGIIGRNGAGKSTLLKLLSRITRPTVGRAVVEGRVGSLLEVGTGFHPELSGRDNIYLNGSILGMDRAYIERRFEEIVEFAGVERFIDTPVKRYSSGMYLRLAFAVAAHLEPEVLVVDEVLAVGDAEFQKKCLGKMGEVAREGRTVLFVSHNMGAVRHLCDSAILLERGSVAHIGSSDTIIAEYLAGAGGSAAECEWNQADAPGDGTARLLAVRVTQPEGVTAPRIDIQLPFQVEIEYEVYTHFPELNLAVLIHDDEGATVLHTTQHLSGSNLTVTPPGRYRSAVSFPAHMLNARHFSVGAYADEPYRRTVWAVERAVDFDVEATHPPMARYAAGSYRGVLGPGLAVWRRFSERPR